MVVDELNVIIELIIIYEDTAVEENMKRVLEVFRDLNTDPEKIELVFAKTKCLN